MNKVNKKAYVCAFCIAAASNFGFSVAYAYLSYYVAFQTATGYNNTQMGLILTVLGIASTILYLPGGYIADMFDPRVLTTVGLIGAGAVGFFIAMFPSYPIMMSLYVLFAVFAVLIAWNPQMKMLRLIAEDDQQAKIQTMRAYGRTLPILIISLVGSGLLALLNEKTALQVTLCMYGALAIICAIIAAITYEPVRSQLDCNEKRITLKDYAAVLKMPEVWVIGLIGFSAYTANTGISYMQPYLADNYGLSASTTSALAVIAKNSALVAAPIITWIAMKAKVPVTKVLGTSLLLALVAFAIYIVMPGSALPLIVCLICYIVAALCIMATWALQFVPVSEVEIPMAVTGSAIGAISMFSFVSDIFYGTVCGYFIDNFANGYKCIFGMTVVILLAGVLACSNIVKKINSKKA